MRPGFIRDLQDPSCCSPNTAGIEADASASLLAGSDGRRYPGTFDGHALTNAESFGGSLVQTVTIDTKGTVDEQSRSHSACLGGGRR
jgi:hypothetical protein